MTDTITLPRATVQQALEAWEYINKYGFVLADYEGPMEQAITALKAALEQPEQTCNCRWVGDVQTQQCTLHEAHVDAIHEWADRAKAAEAKLAALEQPEQAPQFWEYDDGLTMNRRVYRHGKLMAVIPIEIIQDTPQMRPFRVAHSFGNREHRPTDKQENV
jgi:hypothetical protein